MGQIQLDLRTKKTSWATYIILILCFQSLIYIVPLLTIYSVVTFHWPLLVIILAFMILQHFTSRSYTFINLVNKFVQPLNYFRRFLRIYDEPIDEKETTLFCSVPHGLFSFAVALNANADNSKLSTAIPLAHHLGLYTPIIGLQLRLWGIQSIDHKNMARIMNQRRDIVIVPGGYQESTLTTPDELRIYIKNRLGFIKYALRFGYTIRPTLIYNEHKAYKTMNVLTKFRLALSKYKMTVTFWYGGFLQLFFPLDLQLVTIVGKGIKRDPRNQGKEISPEQIAETHQKYISEIKRLHESYKDQFNSPSLVIY